MQCPEIFPVCNPCPYADAYKFSPFYDRNTYCLARFLVEKKPLLVDDTSSKNQVESMPKRPQDLLQREGNHTKY
jgi:hypothetical protein